MIALIQRVSEASITADGEFRGSIGQGLMVLVCGEKNDKLESADALAEKVVGYRVFSDVDGKMNLSLKTVGGGIIVDGKIVAGAHGAGGEVGHACVDPEEEAVCNCGNHGCLEQMTSATGIVRLAKKYLASHDTPSSLRERGESISAKAVFDALKEGDAAAEAIVQEFSEYLGRALAVFACVVDPEVIVVGGGVSKAGQILIDGVAKYYREAAFIACKDTPIVLASLGNDAGIYGAAKMLID